MARVRRQDVHARNSTRLASPPARRSPSLDRGLRLGLVSSLAVVSLFLSGAGEIEGTIPAGLECLRSAYPEHVCDVTPNAIIWCDGTVMAYDDGRGDKDHESLLEHGDLEDQMSQRYPVGKDYPLPLPQNFEPGRIRHEPFFRKMYGDRRADVSETLGTVRWLKSSVDKRLRVTTVNHVDKRLQAVSDELDKLPAKLRKYVEKVSGTFNWRSIRGTDRLSMHSFAIAIDVGVGFANFWKWSKPGADGEIPYRNRIPMEIVRVFEKHGFIWGGKWYHFDTMHFEFRPELLQDGCVCETGEALQL